MSEVTQIIAAMERGEPMSSERLLPVVYAELRSLAQQKLSHERPGQTLSPTALVHEAFLRLIRPDDNPSWDTTGHFFAAAAESMRRILIDNARRKQSTKHGGQFLRVDVDLHEVTGFPPDGRDAEHLLALDAALDELSADQPDVAELVKLRFFAGLTMADAAESLGISRRTAQRQWAYAKARIHQLMTK